MTRPGIEPRSPGPLANTLTARMGLCKVLNIKDIREHIEDFSILLEFNLK